MSQTVANLADVMKEVWTSDRLEKQFYDGYKWLDKIERTSKFTIGRKAVVPIHKGRSGGVSIKNSAGGALNPADAQRVDRAEYTIPYNWHQIEVETAAINEAAGGGFSVGTALNLEVEGGLSDIRNQVCRQFVSNGDSLIAQCTTTSNTTPVNLLATGYGYDAIARGWLYPGLQVDIGTTGNEVLRADAHFITAVSEDAATPTITLSTTNGGSAANLTTASTDFVSVANARSATTSYESAGLRTIAGSTTSAVGGLDPDTAGEEFWKPASVDTSTTVLSLDLLLTLQRRIMQKGGKPQTDVLSGFYQQQNFYSLLQNQARFAGDSGSAAGDVDSPKWNGLSWNAVNEIPDREVYLLTLEDFLIGTGAKIKKPTWVSDLQGTNQGMTWKQGYTSFVDALVYPVTLAIKRRNRSASAIALTA